MKVVVFGGLGFIGSHVLEKLHDKGVDIVVFDRFKTHYEYRQVDVLYSYFKGDVTDREAVDEVMFGADRFINLAGILGTSETVDNPYPSVESNILGALNIFRAARRNKVRGVQITVGNHWMNNSYSITKSTAERFAFMFNKEHGTKIAVVRALNAYGERQKHYPVRKIMPNFIVNALNNRPISVYGDGEQVMDMIYVKDVADILVAALFSDNAKFDKVYEAGSGRATTVNDIAKIVNEVCGNDAGIEYLPMRQGEPERSIVMGDPTTLKDLGIELLHTLEGTMPQIVDWYRNNYPWDDAL